MVGGAWHCAASPTSERSCVIRCRTSNPTLLHNYLCIGCTHSTLQSRSNHMSSNKNMHEDPVKVHCLGAFSFNGIHPFINWSWNVYMRAHGIDGSLYRSIFSESVLDTTPGSVRGPANSRKSMGVTHSLTHSLNLHALSLSFQPIDIHDCDQDHE